MKATHLRKNLFRILDRSAQTGKPVKIESKGRRFKIIALGRPDKFANLQKHGISGTYSGGNGLRN